jgi:hypothetical protein
MYVGRYILRKRSLLSNLLLQNVTNKCLALDKTTYFHYVLSTEPIPTLQNRQGERSITADKCCGILQQAPPPTKQGLLWLLYVS